MSYFMNFEVGVVAIIVGLAVLIFVIRRMIGRGGDM